MVRQKLLLPALVLSLLAFACGNQPTDDSVLTHIKAGLYSEPALKSANVDVVAKNGVVTLSGQVPDDAARLAAERIASSTPGVKTVVDQTTTAMARTETSANVPPPPPAPAPRPARPAKSAAKHVAAEPASTPVPAPAVSQSPDPGPLHDSATQAADTRPTAPAPPPPPPER